MTREEKLDRFEELDAGRVLGDLDANECAEWRDLSAELGRGGDSGLNLFAAELEASLARGSVQKLPVALAQKLMMAHAPKPAPKKSNIAIFPWVGWAVAACLLGLLVIRGTSPERLPPRPNDARPCCARRRTCRGCRFRHHRRARPR